MNTVPSLINPCSPDQLLTQLDHTMGHVRGKVVDIDGKGISGSRIWIRETGHCAYSDIYGNFVMINIVPALYTMVVECQGFSLCETPDLPIEVGDNPEFRFIMRGLFSPKRLCNRYNANELTLQF